VAGFDSSKGDVIVTLDGDLQNDPGDIPLLLEKISEGYDVISGWRKHRKDHFTRVLPSKLANSIISLTTGVHLHDYGCTLKAYRAACIKPIKAYGEMHRFFPALAKMSGSRIIELPVCHRPRKYGASKYGFNRIFKVLSDIIAINLITKFSSNPLKGFIFSALPFFFLSAFFGAVVAVSLIFQWTPGKSLFFLVASALNLVAAIQLVTLGVLGELVTNTSDLTHTRLQELNRRVILVNKNEPKKPGLNLAQMPMR
jgi:glycosyltransferase involved in cell wall biosynthesis